MWQRGQATEVLEKGNIRLQDREIAGLEEQIRTLRMKLQNHESYEEQKRREYYNLESEYNKLHSSYRNLQACHHNLQTRYHNLEARHNALRWQMSRPGCCG
uniref:Uncharacterized protein n=1 Tax=Oryza barthii TaxID=65489 RepID=A0A0D3FS75_9ORYZ